jgi:hypothetical protein
MKSGAMGEDKGTALIWSQTDGSLGEFLLLQRAMASSTFSPSNLFRDLPMKHHCLFTPSVLIRVWIAALGLLASASSTAAASRGFNVTSIQAKLQADYQAMYDSGARLIRLDCSNSPLATYNPSTFSYVLSTVNLGILKNAISMAGSVNRDSSNTPLMVIIDPHRVFGSNSATGQPENAFTLPASAIFWDDSRHGQAYARFWGDLARTVTSIAPYSAVIDSLEFLNEPAALEWRVGSGATTVDLNAVYRQCMAAVRAHDRVHDCVLMFFEEDFRPFTKSGVNYPQLVQGPAFYAPAGDSGAADRVCYAFHPYWPNNYSLQGIGSYTAGVQWKANGTASYPYMTDANIAKRIGWVETFRASQGLSHDRIYVTEWGCTQGSLSGVGLAWNGNVAIPGNGGHLWMKSVYNRIRLYNWTAHAYRGNNAMLDVTMPLARWNLMRNMLTRSPGTDLN